MNLDELKPLWEIHKERADAQPHWTEADLTELLRRTNTHSYPWLLNFCMTLLLISATGC
ncbi:MAG: hypothetical protein MUD08_06520 [Cytophagales bacterium]|jgi:hypothetical protein|nr:hypothetical protein [Cytophagales bacterium]